MIMVGMFGNLVELEKVSLVLHLPTRCHGQALEDSSRRRQRATEAAGICRRLQIVIIITEQSPSRSTESSN